MTGREPEVEAPITGPKEIMILKKGSQLQTLINKRQTILWSSISANSIP